MICGKTINLFSNCNKLGGLQIKNLAYYISSNNFDFQWGVALKVANMNIHFIVILYGRFKHKGLFCKQQFLMFLNYFGRQLGQF